jgi:hypothetical protein
LLPPLESLAVGWPQPFGGLTAATADSVCIEAFAPGTTSCLALVEEFPVLACAVELCPREDGVAEGEAHLGAGGGGRGNGKVGTRSGMLEEGIGDGSWGEEEWTAYEGVVGWVEAQSQVHIWYASSDDDFGVLKRKFDQNAMGVPSADAWVPSLQRQLVLSAFELHTDVDLETVGALLSEADTPQLLLWCGMVLSILTTVSPDGVSSRSHDGAMNTVPDAAVSSAMKVSAEDGSGKGGKEVLHPFIPSLESLYKEHLLRRRALAALLHEMQEHVAGVMGLEESLGLTAEAVVRAVDGAVDEVLVHTHEKAGSDPGAEGILRASNAIRVEEVAGEVLPVWKQTLPSVGSSRWYTSGMEEEVPQGNLRLESWPGMPDMGFCFHALEPSRHHLEPRDFNR